MGKQLEKLNTALEDFIQKQKMFFVGTAMKEGKVNISPKGMDTFQIVNPKRIIWLNLTGSGNETAAHLLDNNRMTVMFCSFEEAPLILRLYGSANTYHERDDAFQQYIGLFSEFLGARQIFELNIDLVQMSCGFGVPFMEFKAERTRLNTWAVDKGDEGIKKYWEEKNTISLDGHQTNIFETKD